MRAYVFCLFNSDVQKCVRFLKSSSSSSNSQNWQRAISLFELEVGEINQVSAKISNLQRTTKARAVNKISFMYPNNFGDRGYRSIRWLKMTKQTVLWASEHKHHPWKRLGCYMPPDWIQIFVICEFYFASFRPEYAYFVLVVRTHSYCELQNSASRNSSKPFTSSKLFMPFLVNLVDQNSHTAKIRVW